MKLYSWNINGIRAVLRKGDFQTFLKKHDPDILCLQETKAHRDQVEIDLPNYEEYWNSAEKKGYSSTAIFSKIKPISVVNGLSEKSKKGKNFVDNAGRDSLTEGRVITAEYEQFFLVTVYTPNAKDSLERLELRHNAWDPAFLAHCKELEMKKPVIFCGDLNVAHTEIDLARPKPNEGKKGFTAEEREGFQNYIDAGFVDTLRMFKPYTPELYTWWSHWGNARANNVGWRIDYFLISETLKKKITAANIHPDVMGSDHCPVSIELSL